MNISARLIAVTVFLYSLNSLAGNACQSIDVNDPSVPECPSSGSEILPETYPIMAAVVSDREGGPKWVKSYVMNVLKAQPNQPPQFLLPVSDDTYREVLAEAIKQAPNRETAKKWSDSLTKVSGTRWNWQQDYFESFFNKDTGQPVIRHIQGYGRDGNAFDNLASTFQNTCGIAPGAELKTNGRGYGIESGYYGGNIEAIGDFCVLGSDHFTDDKWDAYQKQFCGDVKNAIKAPSSFLQVGHADEMYKTIPLPGKKAPCDFAVAIASPRKALELLKANQNDTFFGFPDKATGEKEIEYDGYQRVCYGMQKSKSSAPAGSGVRGISFFFKLFNKSAQAGNNMVDQSSCLNAKNSDFLTYYQSNSQLSQFNTLVQKDMDDFAADIKAKFKERHNCEPQVVELPYIYQGTLVKEDGVVKTEMGSALSLFPNPSNGEAVGSTLLLPEPVNGAFKKYLIAEYDKLGLKTEYIDTHFAHEIAGNLHCSSHVMRYCRPKK